TLLSDDGNLTLPLVPTSREVRRPRAGLRRPSPAEVGGRTSFISIGPSLGSVYLGPMLSFSAPSPQMFYSPRFLRLYSLNRSAASLTLLCSSSLSAVEFFRYSRMSSTSVERS